MTHTARICRLITIAGLAWAAGPACNAAAAANERQAAVGSGAYALQMPGIHHGEEVVAFDGERWMALVVSDGGAELVETLLSVQPVHDAVVDAPGEATGLEVSAWDGVEAIAFLRGPGLAPGPVAAPLVEPFGLVPGLTLRIDDDLALTLACTVALPAPTEGRCDVRADHAAGSNVIADVPAIVLTGGGILLGDDGRITLLFAGDLDGDGGIDLLMDVSSHYNATRPTLFLWTARRGNRTELQAEAVYEQTGC